MLYTFKNPAGRECAFDMEDKRFRIKPYQQMLSSCSGALLCSLLMTPLDVAKTRLQAQQKRLALNTSFINCPNGEQLLRTHSTHYSGMIDAFFKIGRHEGVTSLWSGLSPTLVLAVPTTICYFVTYEEIRRFLKDFHLKRNPGQTKQPFSIPLIAGAVARVFSVIVVNPLELIRTKMLSQKLSYYDVGKAVQHTLAAEGVCGFWRGLGPTIYRDIPFSGIYWAVYESIKVHNNITVPTFWSSFGGGAVAGCIAAVVTAPFDVVKTHRQIEFGETVLHADKPVTSPPKVGTLAILSNIYRENGVRGMFAGIVPRLIKIVPACAVMITSFEYGRTFFFQYNVDKFVSINGNIC